MRGDAMCVCKSVHQAQGTGFFVCVSVGVSLDKTALCTHTDTLAAAAASVNDLSLALSTDPSQGHTSRTAGERGLCTRQWLTMSVYEWL